MPYPFRLPWTLALMWAMLVTLLAAFLLFGSVRVGAGTWNGRRMRASLIWERFVGYLSSEGFSPPLVGLLVVTVIIAMLGCAWLLWLAFALRDASPPDASPNE